MAGSDSVGLEELTAKVRLARTPTIGPVTYRQLIRRFGNAQEALAGATELAERGGRRLKLFTLDDAQAEIGAAEAAGAAFVTLGDELYPAPLAATEDAPPVMCVIGSREALSRTSVAIVGSRNASVAGRRMATMLAAEIGEAGHAIVSGLARGIDTAAHKASIRTGTVAIMAGGLREIYPPENTDLAAEIAAAGGAVVSEMPFGWKARGRDFPRRNRIISGLALAVVVVEGARRSGSLITARLAAAQGRSVFAVPGSPLDPRAEGTNHLIREGATLVTSATDILEDLAPMAAREPGPERYAGPAATDMAPAEIPAAEHDRIRQDILEALGPAPVLVDDIIRTTRHRPADVHLALLELTLAGHIESHAGQRVSRI